MEAIRLTPDKYVLDITIQGLPATYNSIGHKSHWVKLKNTRQWKWNVKHAVGRFLPKQALKKARLHLVRYSSTPCDYDNLIQSLKPVLDGLVECGVIADDSMSVISKPTYDWKKTERGKGCIRIQVEEIADKN